MLVSLAAALFGAAVTAALTPEEGVSGALAAGARWLAGGALIVLASDVALRLWWPEGETNGFLGVPRAWSGRLAALTGGRAAVLGGVLIAAALLRTPHRLAANLAGYTVVAVAVLWVTRRRAGAAAARAAGLALALFGFVPTHLNVADGPKTQLGAPGSAFQWTAGWPTLDWALSHEIQLARPLDRPALLVLSLAAAPTGRGDVLVRLNGADLGAMRRAPYGTLELPVAVERLAGATRLAFEFRLSPGDPSVRVLAHRWTGGATRGAAASGYFDGARWHRGTFDDLAGRAAGGSYTIELQPR